MMPDAMQCDDEDIFHIRIAEQTEKALGEQTSNRRSVLPKQGDQISFGLRGGRGSSGREGGYHGRRVLPGYYEGALQWKTA